MSCFLLYKQIMSCWSMWLCPALVSARGEPQGHCLGPFVLFLEAGKWHVIRFVIGAICLKSQPQQRAAGPMTRARPWQPSSEAVVSGKWNVLQIVLRAICPLPPKGEMDLNRVPVARHGLILRQDRKIIQLWDRKIIQLWDGKIIQLWDRKIIQGFGREDTKSGFWA